MKIYLCLLGLIILVYSCQNDEKKLAQIIGKEEVIIEELPFEDSLTQIFPSEIIQQIRVYRNDLKEIETAQDVEAFYQSATVLRDTLTFFLRDYTEQSIEESLPDLFWLKEILPTFMPQVVAEGTEYYLFHDYRQWEPIARRTSDLTDDVFVELQYQLHPDDSIEYSYPAYFLQTWD
ncbi:MAG: hypothetical protein AB8G22_02790, partial [Saprospiraceae bacterium]